LETSNKVNVYHYLGFLFEHQSNDQMTDEELELLALVKSYVN